MDVKINQITGAAPVYEPEQVAKTGDEFKFMLMSKISEESLQARLTSLMEEITMQGERISKKKDKMRTWRYGIIPYVAILGVMGILMLLEPHLSGAILIVGTGAVMMNLYDRILLAFSKKNWKKEWKFRLFADAF